jgi:hypothetical protein
MLSRRHEEPPAGMSTWDFRPGILSRGVSVSLPETCDGLPIHFFASIRLFEGTARHVGDIR